MFTRCDDQVAVAFWCECKVVGSSHVPSCEGECNNTYIIRYRYSAGGTKCAILRLSDIILFSPPPDHLLCCDIDSHTHIRAHITFSSQVCRDETCLSRAVIHNSSYTWSYSVVLQSVSTVHAQKSQMVKVVEIGQQSGGSVHWSLRLPRSVSFTSWILKACAIFLLSFWYLSTAHSEVPHGIHMVCDSSLHEGQRVWQVQCI